jgi:inorganic phosphate transporter, PiT family
MFRLLGGIFLGWSLGANDAANIFGTAVACRMIKFSVAATLTAVFVTAGAILEGEAGIHTLSGLTAQDVNSAFIASFAAALTVALMTYLTLPVSTSQAVVGAILGIALGLRQPVAWGQLEKVVLCWIGTPIGGLVIAYSLYKLSQGLLRLVKINLLVFNRLVMWGLVLSGIYGSYALGANNVANVTGVFAGAGLISTQQAMIIGGLSIALGALTYSKRVMITVGGGLVKLDGFSAFIAVLSEAITVHVYAIIGVPVSTSQAVVGAVLGIGVALGSHSIRIRTLLKIFSGWLATPLLAAVLAIAMLRLSALLAMIFQ